MASDFHEGVPFSFFCSLLREISHIKPRTVGVQRRSSIVNHQAYPARKIFRRWVHQLRSVYSPLPPGTTCAIFNLLFPEEDNRRKFDLQETRLSNYLADALGLERCELQRWRTETVSGCLGEQIKIVLQKRYSAYEGDVSPFSVTQMDELLDELASLSPYSEKSIREKRREISDRLSILRTCFRSLSPLDASFLTQIILKDLRPVIYPLPACHYGTALLNFNSVSVKMLKKEHALVDWDTTGWLLSAYYVCQNFEESVRRFEFPGNQKGTNIPQLGVPVAIPKSEKGRSPRHALSYFNRSDRAWAEIKYDGERAQIHVEIRGDQGPKLTIFSKSRRDSTTDRIAVHDTIYHALGISKHGGIWEPKIKNNVILDAEMVACCGEQIDEFWRIRGLVERTVDSTLPSGHTERATTSYLSQSQSPMITESSCRHLGLVFFDILFLDDKSLLSTPYNRRREILESVIQLSPGKIMLAERHPIVMNNSDLQLSLMSIEKVFSDIIATYQEGIVLKGERSVYHDFDTPWVKLKRDYIPGYGDAIDLVVIGAGWDKVRARELRVGPDTFTTLYIGVLANAEAIRSQPSSLPHFEVFFTVSYGMTRIMLEEINFLIRNSETVADSTDKDLGYTFTLLAGLNPPSSIMKTPFLVELVGAGFTKAPKSKHYELRFPRLRKIYRSAERIWKDAIDLQKLHDIACAAIGRNSSHKDARDYCNRLWGKIVSPPAKSSLKRRATRELWQERFATLDGRLNEHCGVRTKFDVPPTVHSAETVPHNNRHSSDPQNTPSPTTKRNCRSLVSDITQYPVVWNSFHGPPRKSSLLDGAVVWFANTVHTPSKLSIALKNSVPRDQRFHSLESFLWGCGWSPDASELSWIQRGIIFVDVSSTNFLNWKTQVLKLIEKRRSQIGFDYPRKVIYVFDTNTWTLENSPSESQAILCLS